jgi:hypothetical protein
MALMAAPALRGSAITVPRPPNRGIDLRATLHLTTVMKWLASLSFVVAGALLTGCVHTQSPPDASAPVIVTPDSSLTGKVVSYNSVGRFVVLNFPSHLMPQNDQLLFLYRVGLKVAEVKITGPQSGDNIVADLVSGDAQSGDEVRDQ